MPPRFAVTFLRWFCKLDYLPDIEGDLFQLYARRLAKKGKKQANLLFYKDVLLLFRPGIIRSFVLINTPNIMVFSLKNIEKRAPKIYKQVFVERRMPKGDDNRLNNEEYNKLEKWLSTQKIY